MPRSAKLEIQSAFIAKHAKGTTILTLHRKNALFARQQEHHLLQVEAQLQSAVEVVEKAMMLMFEMRGVLFACTKFRRLVCHLTLLQRDVHNAVLSVMYPSGPSVLLVVRSRIKRMDIV